MSVTTSLRILQLNKTIYSRLLAAVHLKVGRTSSANTSHRTWRQLKQTLLVDGALFKAGGTGHESRLAPEPAYLWNHYWPRTRHNKAQTGLWV